MITPGLYYHYKHPDLRYRVLGVGKHSESGEDLVIYEALYDNPVSKLWARPLTMFLEKIIIDGKEISRFTYIGPEK
jgi:hypothetical protein